MRALMVVVAVAIAALLATDAVAAARRPARPPSPVRITGCRQDGTTLRIVATGDGAGSFAIAFTDSAGDQQQQPVRAVGPFTVTSPSPFPRGPVRCALADRNAPGDL